jgi:hypothetical protein
LDNNEEEEEETYMSYAGHFDILDTIIKTCINPIVKNTNANFADDNELVSFSNNCTKGILYYLLLISN